MQNKLQYFCRMAEEASKQITGSYQGWTDFLKTVGRLYKYPYHEQVMIHAQRPDATACAEYEIWNKTMRRYVRSGSKGIALIDTGDNPKIRYVFDVSDTVGTENSRPVRLWQLRKEHISYVSKRLEENYNVSGELGFPRQLEHIAAQLSDEYWLSHKADILNIIDDTYLSEYDDLGVQIQFLNAAIVSSVYALYTRCGIDPNEYFTHENFLNVFDFNTPAAALILGTAVSQITQQVLRRIEISVRSYERENERENSLKRAETRENNQNRADAEERTEEYGTDLHKERGLSDTQPEALGNGAEAPRQIRQNEEGLSSKTQTAALERDDISGNAVPASSGNRRSSEQQAGINAAAVSENGGSDRGTQTRRPAEMGGLDEHLQGAGGGSDTERIDLQLNEQEASNETAQLSFFLSEAEQIAFIKEAESNETPSAFSMSVPESSEYNGYNDAFVISEDGKAVVWIQKAADGYLVFSLFEEQLRKAAEQCKIPETFFPMLQELSPSKAEITKASDSFKAFDDVFHDNTANHTGLSVHTMNAILEALGKPTVEVEPVNKEKPQPEANSSFISNYNEIKAQRPDDIVLFQLGDFFEMFGEDAKKAAEILDLQLTTRDIPNVGRVPMCGVPGHTLGKSLEKLREQYDVTVSLAGDGSERTIFSLLSIDHETEQAIDAGEAEYGADGYRVSRDTEHEQQKFNVEKLLEKYKPIIANAISENKAYRNACANSDRENAVIEGSDAVRQAVLDSRDMQLIKAYSDIPDFRHRLHSEVVDETYPKLHDALSQPLTQGDIDSVLIKWNGNIESKRAVVRYMAEHSHDRGTAAWLAAEYGGNSGKNVLIVRAGSPEEMKLTWTNVQRRIARLIQEERFLTDEEQRSPLTSMYKVGDIVYLENDEYKITDIRSNTVELLPNGQTYPIFRAESKGNFERLLHLDERNSRFFADKETTADEIKNDETDTNSFVKDEKASSEYEETPDYHSEQITFFPADKNNLPFDIVIERLSFDKPEPERDEPENDEPEKETESLTVSPVKQITPENFRITDEHLGEGGAKAKFRMNMDAINLLKELEFDGRQATPEQQEILSRYVGWGGLEDAFDETKDGWKNEFKELYTVLSPEEYTAARASTLNAHYTTPTVIRAIYSAVENMGFHGGNILEPSCGVGNFFGLLPESMAGSRLYGVELDSVTGRIAKQLYPKANITIAGFETTDRHDFYDLAVGNVPFGRYQVNDRAYNKLNFNIHNYFFAKALDQIRPGGVIAFVTSHYTMDAKDSTVRRYLAKRAEFLGAIRLPCDAFKKNAGTEVTTDIIFLQKRDRPIEIEPDWVHLGLTEDNLPVNSYFVQHDEMVLGTLQHDDRMYGDRNDIICVPFPNSDLADQLREAIQHIGGIYKEAELTDIGEGEADTSIPADPDVRNYSYTVKDGEVYFRQDSRMVRPALNATARERVKGMVKLRDCVKKLIAQQLDWFVSDIEIQNDTQAELNRLYDDFTRKFGLINSRANSLAFSDDNSYFLLCSLEKTDDENNFAGKADIFTKRTIRPHKVVTSVDTASEALALSISEKACVDMEYMSSLTGKTEEELASDLRGVIYMDFSRKTDGSYTWRTSNDFLSGNVREKLRYYENESELLDNYASENADKLKHRSEIADNITALRQVQPRDLDASEIDVRLGATWVDPSYIRQFMFETFDTPRIQRDYFDVNYAGFTAEWDIKGKNSVRYNDVNAHYTYGTERMSAYRILEDTLNLRDVRVYDTVTDADGIERRVLNSKETTLAQQKQQAIKDAFRDWVWTEPERRQTLVQKYNTLFNSERPREYDGSFLKFPGANPEIQLREHQLNAIARILYGGNTLLAHEVGAGKTFEMIAAAMESKRLGLCHKSLFAVPNHLTEQWASEFLRLYPSANILVATKKDFEPRSRKKFCARIATGDYDAVIIGHSQFERVPVSRERQEKLLYEQINEVEEGIEELGRQNAEHFTIKSLERTKRGLEARLRKLQESPRRDDVVTFEELGVDRLFVDEAHNYKNLFLYTKMRNVAGLSTTDAQKSSDMLLKCRYIDEITEGRGIVFATGTPVSNSMTELYTMMRYLQHETLQQKGLAHFDCWASTFGETVTAIELAPEGYTFLGR